MSKLPDWVPDDEEIAGVIRGECWDVRGGDSRRAARAIRELLELKAGEPDGKPDPAPVASETPTIEKVIDLMGALKAALEPKDRP